MRPTMTPSSRYNAEHRSSPGRLSLGSNENPPPKLPEDVLVQVAQAGGSELLHLMSRSNKALRERLLTPANMREALLADGIAFRVLPSASWLGHDADKIRDMFNSERFFSKLGRTHVFAPLLSEQWSSEYHVGEYAVVRLAKKSVDEESRRRHRPSRRLPVEKVDVLWMGHLRPHWRPLHIPVGGLDRVAVSPSGRWVLVFGALENDHQKSYLFDSREMISDGSLPAVFTEKEALALNFSPDEESLIGHYFSPGAIHFVHINLFGPLLCRSSVSYSVPDLDTVCPVHYSPSLQRAAVEPVDFKNIVFTTTYESDPCFMDPRFWQDLSCENEMAGWSKDETWAWMCAEGGEEVSLVHSLIPPFSVRKFHLPVGQALVDFDDDVAICHTELPVGNENFQLFSVEADPLHGPVRMDKLLPPGRSQRPLCDGFRNGLMSVILNSEVGREDGLSWFFDLRCSPVRVAQVSPGYFFYGERSLLEKDWFVGQKTAGKCCFFQPRDLRRAGFELQIRELRHDVNTVRVANNSKRVFFCDGEDGIFVLPIKDIEKEDRPSYLVRVSL